MQEFNEENEHQRKETPSEASDEDSEICQINFPLAIRALPPHCHTIATWNVNNGFSVDAISIIMHRFNVSILFIQEPLIKFSTSYASHLSNRLQQVGLGSILKDKQFLIYCEDHMGSRIISTTSLDKGRIISIVVQTGKIKDKTFIRVTGCYAYPDGNMTYKTNGKTRDELRKHLFKLVSKLLKSPPKDLPKEATFKGDIFVGDLQETITRSERDN